MSLYQYLTEEDKEKLCSYIRMYGDQRDYIAMYPHKLEHLLRFWDEYKQPFEKLFSNSELRISRNIAFQKDSQYITMELQNLIDHSRFIQNVWHFAYSSYNSHMTNSEKSNLRTAFDRLTSEACLQTNKYDGETYTFNYNNGKKYVLQNGCKAIKALSKLSSIFNINDFEEFQIEYSQIFNEKNLTGTLSISVHPLDYLTMSDNECGWDSCMAWMNEGDYRMGTVEMMNSPYVVVAYLESKKPMTWTEAGQPYEWNNKKWRELFIFSKDCIVPIKGYPYNNEALESTVIYWLRDLAADLGWEYKNTLYMFFGDHADNLTPESNKDEEEVNYPVKFTCNTMYNDLGNKDRNFIFIGKNRIKGQKLSINFSGPAECMNCGERITDVDDPMSVICRECSGYVKCADCGSYIREEDATWIDGRAYCYDCYESYIVTTSIYGDPIPESECSVVDVKLRGYILESTLMTLYLGPSEYNAVNCKGLIHYDTKASFWKTYGSKSQHIFDKRDVIYVDELDQILDEDTWISYKDAIHDIKWAIERYRLYHDEMYIETSDCVLVKYDQDELLDEVEEIVQKAKVEEETI